MCFYVTYVPTVPAGSVVNYFKLIHCLKTGQFNEKVLLKFILPNLRTQTIGHIHFIPRFYIKRL